MAKRFVLACAVAFCTFAPGCATARQPATSTTTASPSTSVTPQEDARRIMGDFGIVLPTDATQVQVIKPALGDYRAKAVISFLAPREEVMTQTCQNVQYKHFDYPPIMADGLVDEVLSQASISINRLDFRSCDQYQGGRKILVLIPLAENRPTYVVLYHAPYR
jgi:hypothetical protein